ncbi:LSU ribosomal protein L25P [Thermanaeromonas toyohensis ToBE]|uniref:Large ribosomal subunit protein bL25 n=2 Tax=Thermanaeromonas TaxID=202949 RepID=A0A1W1V905_9FIRM|nr:LSU ribosomal protein L25P [Thermanaeromonas toyohensis ToBE]
MFMLKMTNLCYIIISGERGELHFMEASVLTVQPRQKTGKGPARRLRQQGLLPAILYGRDAGNLPIMIKLKELQRVLEREGERALVKVHLEKDGARQEYMALLREVQRDPIRGDLLHVDLYQVPAGEKITVTVPVVLEGEPRGVKAGGILQHGLSELEIECLPADLPEAIVVDVSGLDVGDHLTVADIKPPKGVKILSEPEGLIATVVELEKGEEAEAEEEGGAPEGA